MSSPPRPDMEPSRKCILGWNRTLPWSPSTREPLHKSNRFEEIWRRNEPDLDHWPRVVCSRGENDARKPRVRKSNWPAAHCLGSLARFHGNSSRVSCPLRGGSGQPTAYAEWLLTGPALGT